MDVFLFFSPFLARQDEYPENYGHVSGVGITL
jgi:hypothetical protein